jgi:hypothetical protein
MPLVFLFLKTFKLFDFPILLLWAHLVMLLQKRVVCTKLDIYDFTWHFHQTVQYFTYYNLLNEFKLYNAHLKLPFWILMSIKSRVIYNHGEWKRFI